MSPVPEMVSFPLPITVQLKFSPKVPDAISASGSTLYLGTYLIEPVELAMESQLVFQAG